jgi:crossover junction endodeoxyribonuclease RuvC
MLVAGIDPGKAGALVILRDGVIEDMALLKNVVPRFWLLQRNVKVIYIEQAQSFPKQGIASAFNYGRDFGYLLGTLAGSGMIIHLVRPAVWARRIHTMAPKIDDAKERSLWCARHLWPEQTWLATSKSSKAHDGLVDAALIALYGHLNELLPESSQNHAADLDALSLD